MGRLRNLSGIFTIVAMVAVMGIMTAPMAGASTGWHRETFTVVADHLGNPRGLSPAPGGGLYLAEAGSGGTVCVPGGPAGQTCIGLTGSFDRVSASGVTRIVTGLISASGPGGMRRWMPTPASPMKATQRRTCAGSWSWSERRCWSCGSSGRRWRGFWQARRSGRR